jgi:hypothetical protein
MNFRSFVFHSAFRAFSSSRVSGASTSMAIGDHCTANGHSDGRSFGSCANYKRVKRLLRRLQPPGRRGVDTRNASLNDTWEAGSGSASIATTGAATFFGGILGVDSSYVCTLHCSDVLSASASVQVPA